MRLGQGTFSFLPDLSDQQIAAQLDYCLGRGWALSIEFTDDPHPRNTYWEMWVAPMFDLKDAAAAMLEVKACRAAHPQKYVKVNGFDATRGWETVRLSFIVNRPSSEPGFRLERSESRRPCHPIYDARLCRGQARRQPLLRKRQCRRTTRPIWISPPWISTGCIASRTSPPCSDSLDRDLVGLAPVKRRVREIAALLLVEKLRRSIGLEAESPPLHMSFTGNPGTGKTTVAARMAAILHGLGYVRKGQLVAVTRDDLVGQFIGHTAPKTKEVIKRAMGGVLFIDEAYHLHRPENERDYGQEVVEILLQVMETQRADLVVIFAGYKDRMVSFFDSNPGMASRVAHHIDFPDYSDDELFQIAGLMLARMQYSLSEEAVPVLREYIVQRRGQPNFSNARSIRNALDRARLRHANRLFERRGSPLSASALTTIAPEDFRASRVFRSGLPA